MMTRHPDPMNLIVTGVGGQGNVLISQILGRALLSNGYQVAVGETFGLSQRGGSVQSHIRFSRDKACGPLIPENGAHAVLGLEPMETLRILPKYGRADIQIVVNSRPIPPMNVIAGEARYPSGELLHQALGELARNVWWVDGTDTAQKLGNAVMANIVLLGCLVSAGLTPLEPGDVETAMGDVLPAHRLEQNVLAFQKGLKLIEYRE